MSLNPNYCDDFLNTPLYDTPKKLRLNTMPEASTESSSITGTYTYGEKAFRIDIVAAVTISPLNFSDQLNFLQDDRPNSAGSHWFHSLSPKTERKIGVQNYLENALDLADGQKLRNKRVRVGVAPFGGFCNS
jgi:hypothetical protein